MDRIFEMGFALVKRCLPIVILLNGAFAYVSEVSPAVPQFEYLKESLQSIDGSELNDDEDNSPAIKVEKLDWLAGFWLAQNDRSRVEEHWTIPKQGNMIGMNRTISNRGRVSFEFLRIQATEKDATYWASPGGKQPVGFKLVEQQQHRVVFENKEHDFPQRIIYHLDGETLHARIEGSQNGRELMLEWEFKKQGPTP